MIWQTDFMVLKYSISSDEILKSIIEIFLGIITAAVECKDDL